MTIGLSTILIIGNIMQINQDAQNIKLILVDDHDIIRYALVKLLEGSGKFSICGEARNGQEALDLIDINKADLVIMDISMPEISGIEVTRLLRNKQCLVPILALSGSDDAPDIKEMLDAGANGYIPKNASYQELEFAISSLINGKTYLSPSITQKLIDYRKDDHDALQQLTEREREIATYLVDGKRNRDIGKLLHISTRTVDTHRSNILKKLNIKSNAELVKLVLHKR
jgi:two-component system, NarL family, response regulator NreC